MENNSKIRFLLSSFGAMLVMAGAIDATGQSVAPVNPRFSEWQKRKAVDNASQNGQIDNATNLTKGTSARRAATVNVDSEEIGLGLVPDIMDMDYLADINAGVVRAPVGGFPASYDLRAQGGLTDVRDQNPYGTCWAFATMASLESGILGREGLATDFSENNLANLHGWDYNGFIDGGNATMAMAYLTRWGGPVNETDDPYPAIAGSVALAPVRHVQKVVWIPGKTDSLDNDAIKEAIMEHGALFATYCHSSSYYNPSTSSYHYTGKSPANHAVAIVGWDDGYPASNFAVRPSGNGAYLVRNSWGASWGNGGYFWVSYFDKVFARSTMYAFSSAEPTDNYGKIYQHDQLGMVSAFSVNWGANVFTATDADSIAAVGFYALAPNTGYSISIYTRCQAGRPTSGTCALTQSGTIPEPGFTTIPLSSAVAVTSGSRFSVVLRLTTPGYAYPHAIEYAYTGITSGATASSGQSFYSSNGSSWTDLTSWNSTANLCIKAYTASAVATPTLASIAIAGPATVKSGETAAYTCTARYSDNSEKTVSPAWTLPSGSDYASINAAGTLAAYDTTTGRSVVICATYAEDGVTKTAEMAVAITAAPPSAPIGLTATQGDETRAVRLSWIAVPGAENYSIYRGTTAATANAQYLGVAEGNKYSDTTAVPGRDYWYFVKARNGSGTGPFSEGANGWRALSAPADIAASDGASEASVAVSWSPVEGAAAYMVWRSEGFDAEPTALSGWLSATEFADATAVPGTDYWYSVSAATDATGLRPSERGVPDDGFRAIPVVPEALAIDGDASIPAGGTASYSAYVLYSDGHRGESPASPTWAVSTGTVSRTGVVTAPVVAANTETTLSASTTIEGVHVSGEKRIVVTAVVPAAPANLRVVSATAAGGVALAWDAVPGASAYTLTRAAGADGSSVEFATTDSTSFIDTAAIPGLLYTYGVAAANAVGTGPQSVAVTATIPLAAPTGVSATIDRTDCVRVSWGAVMGATHYHVARADSEDGAKTELGTWTDALSFDDTMAVADTTVFYFVKAATDATGANASAWSDAVQGMRKPERVLVLLTISGPERVPSGGEAIYVCTATYSDGTVSKVAPAWGATLGAIGADGKFTAPSVESDAAVAITASFGGLSADFAVAIVAPVVERTAEITTVTAAQRWPFSGLVDIDYTLATAPAGTKATVSVSATDEDHNAVLPATTLSGDGADGSPVEAGSHRITWNLAADHPGFHAASVGVSLSAVPAIFVSVTFDGNGGVPSQSTLSGVVGEAYGLLPTATREGYDFAGWFTAASEGTQVTATSLFDENVTTLYAQWTANHPHARAKVQLWEGGPYWATVNIGAENPEDSGLYFWWGDTVGYRREGDVWVASDGSSSNFSFSSEYTPTYGKDNVTLQSEGWITADGVLSPAHDAAHVHWGGNWRMPTNDELTALNNNCDWTSTTQNGVNGYVVRGRGGFSEASIFLPGAGYGYGTSLYNAGSGGSCWSSVPYSYNNYDFSRLLDFGNGNHLTSNYYRYGGLSVRPVQGGTDVEAETYVMTLDAQGGSGGTTSVIATNGAAMPTITIPTRANYTFGGYWTGTDGIGTQYYTASGASARVCDLTADTTLYAKWTANDTSSTYLVIDLSGGADATNYPVSYLASVPEGGWTDEYKTTKLVLRKIPAGTFTMGCDTNEVGYYGSEAVPHQVTISKPFFIGVFEVTQRQWELVMGTKPSYFANTSCYTTRPVEQVSYDMIRGSSGGAGWPSSTEVDSTSFLGKLRAKIVGGLRWDLPTEAMWEYACRAGTNTALNSGKNLTNTSSDSNLAEVGRYGYNGGQNYSEFCDTSAGTAKVGSYLPNNWGLYDMLGNVWEWTLDRYQGRDSFPSSAVINPVGPDAGTDRVLRGGCWFDNAQSCRSAHRHFFSPSFESNFYGLRLAAFVEDKVQLWEGGPYWATTNIGADEPWESGLYFWWGDIVGYRREGDAWVASDGSSSNFSFSKENTLTYYKTQAILHSEGWVVLKDDVYVLAPEHDAAQVQWGGGWRMPTERELQYLTSNCDWTWTTVNGMNGHIVRGRGNYSEASIFLPASGYGYGDSLDYADSLGSNWSSVPHTGGGIACGSLCYSGYHTTGYVECYSGRSVRPVQGLTE